MDFKDFISTTVDSESIFYEDYVIANKIALEFKQLPDESKSRFQSYLKNTSRTGSGVFTDGESKIAIPKSMGFAGNDLIKFVEAVNRKLEDDRKEQAEKKHYELINDNLQNGSLTVAQTILNTFINEHEVLIPLLKVDYFLNYNEFIKSNEIPSDFFIIVKPEEWVESFFITHRWQNIKNPDPKKEQFEFCKAQMPKMMFSVGENKYPCKYFFYDYSCLKQGDKTVDEHKLFKSQLVLLKSLISRSTTLYIKTDDYYDRAWCVFEATFSKDTRNYDYPKIVSITKAISQRKSMFGTFWPITLPFFLVFLILKQVFSVIYLIFLLLTCGFKGNEEKLSNCCLEPLIYTLCCYYKCWNNKITATNGDDVSEIYNVL